jgi:NADH-quinone oxidoreductase subunit H
MFVYVWVRGTLPRLRYDQLMGFGWKFLLPLSILNVVITSLAIVLTQR